MVPMTELEMRDLFEARMGTSLMPIEMWSVALLNTAAHPLAWDLEAPYISASYPKAAASAVDSR